MKISFAGPLTVAAGALIGAASAVVSARTLGVNASGGIWQLQASTAVSLAQPYALANYVLDGRLPPPAGQIAEFAADRDAGGGRLSSGCTYLLKAGAGALPRWWSVTALASGSGRAPEVVSAETVVSAKDGTVAIAVSAVPQPGNWLAAPGAREFRLIYSGADSGALGGPAAESAPFSVDKVGC